MAASAEPSSELEDLAVFEGKRLVLVGGFGTGASGTVGTQWRSLWEAFKQYGD